MIDRRDVLALALLVAAVAGCFHAFTLFGTFSIADDTLAIHYPVLAGFYAQVRQGDWPTWFPEILLGYPGAGSVEFHLLSPFHWAFLVTRPELAVALRFLSIHLVSALAMFALGRHFEMGRPGAMTAALVWALAPPAVFMLIEPMASATVPWFPLVLLCWDRACRSRSWRWLLAGGLTLGLALLGGHLQHVLWFIVFLAAYTVVVRREASRIGRWRQAGLAAAGLAVMAAVALAVAAVEILPSFELFRDSIRTTLAAHERLPREQPSWLETPLLLSATLFTVEKPRFSLDYARVGLVPLALAIIAVGRGRRFENRLLLVAGAFLLLALGDTFPPANWVLRTIPGNHFRFAERIGLVFTFAVAVLAGRGADALLHAERRPWRRLAVLAAVALGAGAPLVSTDVFSRQEVLAGLFGLSLIAAAVAMQGRGRRWSLALSLVVMLAWSTRGVHAVGAAEDAVVVGTGSATSREGGPWPPTWLREIPREDENGPTRLLCIACPRGNGAFLTGHQTPTGYVTLRPSRVERLVYARQRVSETDAAAAATLGRHQLLLDLLGIGHVVVRAPAADHFSAEQRERSLTLRGAVDGLEIFENRTRLPRSYFVSRTVRASTGEEAWSRITAPSFDPRREVVLEDVAEAALPPAGVTFMPARVSRYESGRVDVEVDAPGRGFLILLDRWGEGWHGEVNGRAVPIARANYLFRAVPVEAGPNVARFQYRDARFIRAAWISVLTIGGVAMALLVPALRRRASIVSPPAREPGPGDESHQ